MEITQSNPFLVHANSMDRFAICKKMGPLILENIQTLAKNAFTEGYISLNRIKDVTPPSFHFKTLKFVLKQDPSEECSDDPIHIKNFFDFMCSYLFALVVMRVGEKETFFYRFFCEKKSCLDSSLDYLAVYYLVEGRLSDKKNVSLAKQGLNSALCGLGIVHRYSEEHIQQYGNLFEFPEYLIKNTRYAPLAKVYNQELKKVLGRGCFEFFRTCLSMHEDTLRDFCLELEGIFDLESSYDRLCGFFLNRALFDLLHTQMAKQLLRPQELHETGKEFKERTRRKEVLEAISYIQRRARVTRLLSGSEKHLREFLDHFGIPIFSSYKPFQNILDFIFDCELSMEDEYPTIPIRGIRESEIMQFFVNVLLAVRDISEVHMRSSDGRLTLLKAAEFLLVNPESKYSIRQLKHWVKFFPEIEKCPDIKRAIEKQLNGYQS